VEQLVLVDAREVERLIIDHGLDRPHIRRGEVDGPGGEGGRADRREAGVLPLRRLDLARAGEVRYGHQVREGRWAFGAFSSGPLAWACDRFG